MHKRTWYLGKTGQQDEDMNDEINHVTLTYLCTQWDGAHYYLDCLPLMSWCSPSLLQMCSRQVTVHSSPEFHHLRKIHDMTWQLTCITANDGLNIVLWCMGKGKESMNTLVLIGYVLWSYTVWTKIIFNCKLKIKVMTLFKCCVSPVLWIRKTVNKWTNEYFK